MTALPIALAFDQVDFAYAGRVVLEQVSLQVHAGEFVALIGPNGGGKSTFVKLALGLLRPAGGSVRVLGTSAELARPRIGYVAQFATFRRDFPLCVRDTVLQGRLGRSAWWRWLTAADSAAADDAMKAADVWNLAQRPIAELSGGQLQRVMIARALATDPELLLLDEPTAHVDSQTEHGLFDLLDELRQRMAIIMVSHDVGLVSRHVDSIACLNRSMIHHAAVPLAADVLERLYGMPLRLVDHAHAQPLEAQP